MDKIFPINLYPSGRQGGITRDFKENFLKTRKESIYADYIWYAVTVSILSNSSVEYHVHDILDNVYGGVGKKLYTITAEVNPNVIEPYIRQRLYDMAEEEIDREEKQRRHNAINARANQISRRIGVYPTLKKSKETINDG